MKILLSLLASILLNQASSVIVVSDEKMELKPEKFDEIGLYFLDYSNNKEQLDTYELVVNRYYMSKFLSSVTVSIMSENNTKLFSMGGNMMRSDNNEKCSIVFHVTRSELDKIRIKFSYYDKKDSTHLDIIASSLESILVPEDT